MTYQEYLLNKRPYQEYGALFLLTQKHACLFYKPGLGKTYPCIDAIREIDADKKGKATVLILSTADAIKNMWQSEIDPQNILPTYTTMMSFSKAIQEKTKVDLLRTQWDCIVIDESHKIKSHNSQISKLVYRLTKHAEYCFALSGTPRGNNDVDIYCQFHNMNIGNWGNINYTSFINNCCDVETRYFSGHTIHSPVGINEQYRAGWERNIAMYTQRMDYTDEYEMPDITVNTIPLPYKRTKEYKQAEEGVICIPEYETTMTKLSAITKLHQIANGYMYYTTDERLTYTIERNKKLDWLAEQDLHNTVIVYRFHEDLHQLEEFLSTNGYKFTEIVDTFKNSEADVLLLQCSRCESFNLQCCKHMIFYTLDYSYIKYNQMLHRIWRMGQTDDVQIDVLIHKGSIEENIWHAVQNKEKLAQLFMSIKESCNGQ